MTDSSISTQDRTEPSVWPVVLGAAAALLALRYGILLASDLGLHGDEAQYWTWSRSFEFGYYSKPPLIAWVIGAATTVCGDAAWCVRAPAALFHVASACVLTGLAKALFDDRTALWTGIAWLTLPAVSFSSLIMSTDAILLFFWAAALWAYRALLDRPGIGPASALALAFGFGLNAKYAMAYFLLCLVLHLAVSPDARSKARTAWLPLFLALAAGGAMILPNVAWNAANGWATVGHTADNAHWQGIVLHFDEMGDFLSAQFGVFGPVFFLVLLAAWPLARRRTEGLNDPMRMLLAFSLPVLAIITVQALLSRANANWAATAYPAATVLVAALLVRTAGRRRLLAASIGLHGAAALVLYAAVAMPDRTAEALGRDPFEDLSGWQGVADTVADLTAETDTSVILMDNRMMTASLAWALRNRPDLTIRAWNHDRKIDHHYEMAWLYDPATDGPRALLITPHGVEPYEKAFDTVTALPDIPRADRAGETHPLKARLLEGPQ